MSNYTLTPDQRITPKEASSISGFQVNTLANKRLNRTSPFPHYKLGGRIYYHRQEVMDWLRSCEISA